MLRLPDSALGRRAAPEAAAQHAGELSWRSSSASSPLDWDRITQDGPAGSQGRGARRFLDWWELTGDAPLGQGSVGDVELARPVGGGAPCAVKVISKIHCAREAAVQEAEIMRPLRHPAVCRLVDTCEDARNVYLVLEHIDGHELFEEIESISGSANEVRAAQIMRQVLEGLAYCHDEGGVVHRDIKPENIMVSDAGGGAPSAKLIDFGIALRAGDICDELEGTEPYLAPEARYSARAHQSSDLWSVGVVLHVLLTGQLLPEAVQLGHAYLDLERGALAGRRMSTPAKDLVAGLLHPEPRERLSASTAAAHPWLRRVDPSPAAAPAAPSCPGRWKALAVCFGQLAGSAQLRALRQRCLGLAADSQGRVGKDELSRLVRATALAGAATLPFCVTEALSTLDLEGCGRVASDDWLAWLVAAAEGVDAACNLAGSIMDKAFLAAGNVRRGAALRQATQVPTPCRSRGSLPARRPVSMDLALAC